MIDSYWTAEWEELSRGPRHEGSHSQRGFVDNNQIWHFVSPGRETGEKCVRRVVKRGKRGMKREKIRPIGKEKKEEA